MPHHRKSAQNIAQHEKLKAIVKNLEITGRIVNMNALQRQLEFGNLKLKNVVRELHNYSESLDSDTVEKANTPGLSDELAELVTVVKTGCDVKELGFPDERPIPSASSQLEAENHNRRTLTIYDIPLHLVHDIVKKLHPLEKFGCYEVCTGMRRIVAKSLANPETLGIYISDNTCVVYSDGGYCKYTKDSGGCGYQYGTYGPKNANGYWQDHTIPFDIKENTGFLKNVKYNKAGLNVFLSVLTKHGHHFMELTIKAKYGYNPNKMIMRIEKNLCSLKKPLSVHSIDLVHMSPKRMMGIIQHLKPEIIAKIQLHKNSYGNTDEETMRMIARTKQWKNAKHIRVYFPTTIPIKKFRHLQRSFIERYKMTARELANLRNSVLKHTHIEEIELVIHDPTVDIGILRRVLGTFFTPDPTDADSRYYIGPNGVVDVYINTEEDNRNPLAMMLHRWPELPVFE